MTTATIKIECKDEYTVYQLLNTLKKRTGEWFCENHTSFQGMGIKGPLVRDDGWPLGDKWDVEVEIHMPGEGTENGYG